MDEATLRRILLVRACEEADREGLVVPPEARQAATHDAVAAGGPPEAVLAARADALFARIEREQPRAAAAARRFRLAPPRAPLVAAAFAAGLLADALGRERHLNLLAFPILGLLAWNLAVYAAMLLGAFARRAPASERAMRWWIALRARLARAAGDAGFAGRVAVRFPTLWLARAGPLERARWRGRLHGGALALALGVVAGMYVAGFAFAYEATWESTFLDAPQVHALLAAVLGPASWLLGEPLPGVEQVARLRAPGGEPAALWIHRWALTALLVVGIPRAALALRAGVRARRLRERLAPDLDAPYYARILSVGRGEGSAVQVIPYSVDPSPEATARLQELAHDLFGSRAAVRVEPPAAYGASPLPTGSARATVVVFHLAQSPEREVHGRYLEQLRAARPDDHPLLVLLDAERYRRLVEDERVEQRRRAWERVLREVGASAALLDPEQDADALLERARAVLGSHREAASA